MEEEIVNMQSLPKIFLRAMEPEDLNFLYEVENDECLWHTTITNVPYSRYALTNFIANSIGDIFTDRQVRLMVDNAYHETVGMVDLVNFEPQHLRAELGVIIRPSCQGRGYAQAAVSHVIDYAKKVIHLHQLYAIVSVENNTCLNALQICGFEKRVVLFFCG